MIWNIFNQIFVLMLTILYSGELCGELYCFGIRTQNIVFYCLYMSKTNFVQLNNLSIKILTKDNLSKNKWRIFSYLVSVIFIKYMYLYRERIF